MNWKKLWSPTKATVQPKQQCRPQYLAFGKALLARLYLKVKVYITNLLSVYNLQKISCLKWSNFVWIFIFLRIPLTLKTYLYWTLNERFCFNPILFRWRLTLALFFTRCLYFHHNWWRERGTKINSSTIFEGCYLYLRKKKEIHKHSRLSIIWIFNKFRFFTLPLEIPDKTKLHH